MATLGYATAGDVAKPTSVFDRLDRAVSNLTETSNRVLALADRLTGSVPQPVAPTGGKIGDGSVFSSVGVSSDRLDEIASDIASSLCRIERALP